MCNEKTKNHIANNIIYILTGCIKQVETKAGGIGNKVKEEYLFENDAKKY